MSIRGFRVRKGDSEYDHHYRGSDIAVTIEHEYDFYPYHVFFGRIDLSRQDTIFESITLPAQHADFFLVNYFNSATAERNRGKGYHPDHYIQHSVNFGFDHPGQEPKNPKMTALPSSWFGR